MEKKYFLLEAKDNSRVTCVFHLVLGIVCVLIAIFWIIFNFSSLKSENTFWITIIFLALFGSYEILAGLGRTVKYIEILPGSIILKQHSVLPKVTIKASLIEKIEIFPLSVVFSLKNRSRNILRFGISYSEIIIPAKEALTEFAEYNSIPVEIKDEEI